MPFCFDIPFSYIYIPNSQSASANKVTIIITHNVISDQVQNIKDGYWDILIVFLENHETSSEIYYLS